MLESEKRLTPYKLLCIILLIALAIFFLFPLYWIVTGSVKTKADIIVKAGEAVKWWPTTISWGNFERLFKSQSELFGAKLPWQSAGCSTAYLYLLYPWVSPA